MNHDEHDPQNLDRDLRDLQVLDPADVPRPDAGRGPAAQAILDRVLQESQDSTARDHDELARRRKGLRWGLVGAAAAAAVAALMVWSPWGPPEHAFATWTAEPEAVPADFLDDVGARCSGGSYSAFWEEDAVIAEERGSFTFVVALSTTMLNHCMLVDGEFVQSGASTGARGIDEVAPDEVRPLLVSGGGYEEGPLTVMTGEVGDEVVGVEVHPSGHRSPVGDPPWGVSEQELPDSVTATVDDGYFGAWWPGASEDHELTVHLADGTTISNVLVFDD